MKKQRHSLISIAALVSGAALLAGTWWNPGFWRRPDQRAADLMNDHRYDAAAQADPDPLGAGVALYRGGRFEEAAETFTRVPGATGAYNAGNALLMHGQYDSAIASYDRALGFRAGWREALDNRQLAVARRDRLKAPDDERQQESAEAYDPDEIRLDLKIGNRDRRDREPLGGSLDDAALQATWLRKVQTTPGEFLKAKFAFQAQAPSAP